MTGLGHWLPGCSLAGPRHASDSDTEPTVSPQPQVSTCDQRPRLDTEPNKPHCRDKLFLAFIKKHLEDLNKHSDYLLAYSALKTKSFCFWMDAKEGFCLGIGFCFRISANLLKRPSPWND